MYELCYTSLAPRSASFKGYPVAAKGVYAFFRTPRAGHNLSRPGRQPGKVAGLLVAGITPGFYYGLGWIRAGVIQSGESQMLLKIELVYCAV